ncbi:MAG: AAA family ATPase [Burkholderiales bacterium]
MYIASVRIKNYKSYRDSGDVPLASGFSIVVGKNDSGKSAFLESLSLANPSLPHRSIVTAPTSDTPDDPDSLTEVKAVFSRADVQSILRKHKSFGVPAPEGDPGAFARRALDLLEHDVSIVSVWVGGALQQAWFEALGQIVVGHSVPCKNLAAPSGVNITMNTGGGDHLPLLLAQQVRPWVYAFRAERLNVGQIGASGNPNLTSDAGNLADVLNRLISGNRARFDRLMGYVRNVFPHVTNITIPIVHGQNVARVSVWGRPTDEEREDLAVPLIYSGTGIGQVLAILYVVVTANSPRVFVIDEPQSFLHPGAFRKLLEILRENHQHQYIISSHAPLALGSSQDHVLLARRIDQETRIEPIDAGDQIGLRAFLSEVGARLSDVFGSDAILWVEGKTEESCFPELIRLLGGTSLRGVQILGVVSTDELGARHAERVFDIYSKLSSGPTLMPPALRFVFDREGRTASAMAELEQRSKGLVAWLPRRMYENFLLDPSAISTVLSMLDGREHTAGSVTEWLVKRGTDSKFLASSAKPIDEEWQNTVHAAKLLHDLFLELTDSRVEYQKVNHGLLLTRHLVVNPTPAIRDLAVMLAKLVQVETAVG